MTAPFYGEYKTEANQTLSLAQPTATASVTIQAKAALTQEALSVRVLAAVVTVMGTAPAPDQPLVEAGLDSLGRPGCDLCTSAALHPMRHYLH